MDGHKFDDLVKRICSTRLTRGGALRGLAASIATALTGGRFGIRGVAANEPVACKCTDDLSPKQCPKNSGIEYTCKLCKGIKQGSVQVLCKDDRTPICVCQSTKCVVGDETFEKGKPVTVCKPVKCPTTDNCDDGDKCTIDKCVDGICEHKPVPCEPKDKCERCKCFPDKGCVCTPVVCKPKDQCEKDCVCDKEKGCVCKPVECPPKPGCTVKCDPVKGCVYTCICTHSTGPNNCKDACTASGSGCGGPCEDICGPACPQGTENRQCPDSDYCDPKCFKDCKFIC